MSRVADLTGQRVLVTGASSGIGAGMAEEFARRGAAVGICARRKDRLEEGLARCRAHSPTSRMWGTDMTGARAVCSLAASALEERGRLDILGNNAGIPQRRQGTSVLPMPVSELVTAVFDALERGVSQVYVPGWFSDLAAQKAKDLDTYLSGVAEWMAVNRRRD